MGLVDILKVWSVFDIKYLTPLTAPTLKATLLAKLAGSIEQNITIYYTLGTYLRQGP